MDLRSAHEPATIFHRPAARHIFRSPRFHRRIGWRDWRRDCIGTDHLAVCHSHRLGCNSDRPYRMGLGCRGEIELRRNKNSCQPRRPKYPDVRAHRALLWSRHARSGWLGPYPSRKGGWWDESLFDRTRCAECTLSWSLVHTVFTLRYARTFYSKPQGGIDFNEDDPPTYLDFAYLALTIGMTFQVSDTNLTTKRIRRIALAHAAFSYLFGAVIVGLVINVVASLLH
jgi:hypothetical protein